MFEREHHRRVANVLEALDAERLAADECLFGGGTALALRHGEYRESVDIDFLISNPDGYRRLRQRLASQEGLRAITRPSLLLNPARELRIRTRTGIRTVLPVDGVDIKFEIVLEGRLSLDPSDAGDRLCGVASLTPLEPLDRAASELLANSDHWRDDAVLSRDLIDLAMMAPPRKLLRQAIDKAKGAYGDSIEGDLAKAVLWTRIKALVPGPSAALQDAREEP